MSGLGTLLDELFAAVPSEGELEPGHLATAKALLALPRYQGAPEPEQRLYEDIAAVVSSIGNMKYERTRNTLEWSRHSVFYLKLEDEKTALEAIPSDARIRPGGHGQTLRWARRAVFVRVVAELLALPPVAGADLGTESAPPLPLPERDEGRSALVSWSISHGYTVKRILVRRSPSVDAWIGRSTLCDDIVVHIEGHPRYDRAKDRNGSKTLLTVPRPSSETRLVSVVCDENPSASPRVVSARGEPVTKIDITGLIPEYGKMQLTFKSCRRVYKAQAERNELAISYEVLHPMEELSLAGPNEINLGEDATLYRLGVADSAPRRLQSSNTQSWVTIKYPDINYRYDLVLTPMSKLRAQVQLNRLKRSVE